MRACISIRRRPCNLFPTKWISLSMICPISPSDFSFQYCGPRSVMFKYSLRFVSPDVSRLICVCHRLVSLFKPLFFCRSVVHRGLSCCPLIDRLISMRIECVIRIATISGDHPSILTVFRLPVFLAAFTHSFVILRRYRSVCDLD